MTPERITRHIQDALDAARLGALKGVPPSVVDTIHQALERAGLRPRAPDAQAAAPAAGRVFEHVHAGPAGSRAYRLYVPSSYRPGRPMPLVLMLHGCQQDPDDFARGTRMNEVAEERGLLVAYPAQARSANGSNCWRWYEAQQQRRAGEEPQVLVGIVREIARRHAVDARRVYAAGLSAGAAMAVILGDTWPEVFAAVAAHSGLPRGAAHDVPSAFAAMHGGAPMPRPTRAPAVPTIVLHGDADATVVPANGDAIAAAAAGRFVEQLGPLERDEQRRVLHGRPCVQTVLRDDDGRPLVEHWRIGGAGHAWCGGDPAGSFTDAAGPDASREIARFFMLHALADVVETVNET